MPSTPLTPSRSMMDGTAITQKSGTVRPASSEQALAMMDLMIAEIVSIMVAANADMATRFPLYADEAERSAGEAQAAKNRLSLAMQAYAKRYGKIDVP